MNAPRFRTVQYTAFCDPSGGSGSDSFTLAVGHREGDTAFVDAIRETRPPFSPSTCIKRYAELLQSYRVSRLGATDKFTLFT